MRRIVAAFQARFRPDRDRFADAKAEHCLRDQQTAQQSNPQVPINPPGIGGFSG